MAERGTKKLYYDYPLDQHDRWTAAAQWKGQPLKEWVRRALNEAAEADEVKRAEDERKRRGR